MEEQQYHSPTLRLVSINQLLQMGEYQWLTRASIRHLIFAANDRTNSAGEVIPGNGLDKALIRVGRRVLIDLDQMTIWLEGHREHELVL